MWEITCICEKWLKYLKNGKKYVGNDVDHILNMASMRGKRLKYLRNQITMLEMT